MNVIVQALKPSSIEWQTVDRLSEANVLLKVQLISFDKLMSIALDHCNAWRNAGSDIKGAFTGYRFRVHKIVAKPVSPTGRKIIRGIDHKAVKAPQPSV